MRLRLCCSAQRTASQVQSRDGKGGCSRPRYSAQHTINVDTGMAVKDQNLRTTHLSCLGTVPRVVNVNKERARSIIVYCQDGNKLNFFSPVVKDKTRIRQVKRHGMAWHGQDTRKPTSVTSLNHSSHPSSEHQQEQNSLSIDRPPPRCAFFIAKHIKKQKNPNP